MIHPWHMLLNDNARITYVQQELHQSVCREQAVKLDHAVIFENIHAALLLQACELDVWIEVFQFIFSATFILVLT